jgi:hypothetical protein
MGRTLSVVAPAIVCVFLFSTMYTNGGQGTRMMDNLCITDNFIDEQADRREWGSHYLCDFGRPLKGYIRSGNNMLIGQVMEIIIIYILYPGFVYHQRP